MAKKTMAIQLDTTLALSISNSNWHRSGNVSFVEQLNQDLKVNGVPILVQQPECVEERIRKKASKAFMKFGSAGKSKGAF